MSWYQSCLLWIMAIFCNKIWFGGRNGCASLALLVWLNIVELNQGNSCVLSQFGATWIINSSTHISLADFKWHYLITEGGTRNTLNLNLEIVLVTECQIKVKLLNRSVPDLLPLMCTGRDAQSTSLVWQGERGNMFLLLQWKEDESGTALMSEPPSPFSQMM